MSKLNQGPAKGLLAVSLVVLVVVFAGIYNMLEKQPPKSRIESFYEGIDSSYAHYQFYEVEVDEWVTNSTGTTYGKGKAMPILQLTPTDILEMSDSLDFWVAGYQGDTTSYTGLALVLEWPNKGQFLDEIEFTVGDTLTINSVLVKPGIELLSKGLIHGEVQYE
jgi:hypothetical protein